MNKLFFRGGLMIAFSLLFSELFAQIPTNGLVAYYSFDGTYTDGTGNNPSAVPGLFNTSVGRPLVQFENCGIRGQALRVNGRAGNVDNITPLACQWGVLACRSPWAVEFPLPTQTGTLNINEIISGANDFTVSFWVKQNNVVIPATTSTLRRDQVSIFGRRHLCGPDPSTVFFDIRTRTLGTSNNWGIVTEVTNNPPAAVNSSDLDALPNLDCWVHYTISRVRFFTGSVLVRTYINGGLVGSNVYPGPAAIAINQRLFTVQGQLSAPMPMPLTISGSACIGSSSNNFDGTQPLEGYFDEMRVYNRALNDAEVASLHDAEEPGLVTDFDAFCQPPSSTQVDFDLQNINPSCLNVQWTPTVGVSNTTIPEPLITTGASRVYTIRYNYPQENPNVVCHSDELTIVRLRLNMQKTASSTNVTVGSNVTYSITLCNNGLFDAQNILVTDILPSELLLQNPGGFTVNGSTLTQTIPLLAPNACTTLTFVATALGIPCQNNVIQNCAVATVANCNPITACVNITSSGLGSNGPQFATFSAAIGATALPASGTANTTSVIYGTIVQDLLTYEFGPGSRVLMAPGAQIIVAGGNRELILNNTTVTGCDTLWRSITLEPEARLYVHNNSLIRDAQYAVELKNACRFESRNSQYRNNMIGLYTAPLPIGSYIQFNQFILLDNLFTSSIQGLRPRFNGIQPTAIGQTTSTFLPITGSRGLSGIWFNNVKFLKIGQSSGLVRNTFQRIGNGIVTYLCDMYISDIRCTGIRSFTGYGAAPIGNGVYGNGSNGFHVLSMTNANNLLNFTDCDRGINAVGINVIATGNVMQNVGRGFEASFCQKRQVIANLNTIDANDIGVYLRQNDPTTGGVFAPTLVGTIVFGNNITMGANLPFTGPPSNAAIRVEEFNQSHTVEIGDNNITLTHSRVGVVNLTTYASRTYENNINIAYRGAVNTFNNIDGIFAGGGGTAVSCNEIRLQPTIGTATTALNNQVNNNKNIDGIHLSAVNPGAVIPGSQEAYLVCNQTYGMRTGIRFEGVNDFSNRIAGNRMELHHRGLFLEVPNTQTGPQVNFNTGFLSDYGGNRFIGNPSVIPGAFEAFINPANNAGASQFDVFTGGVPNSPFLPNFVNLVGWFNTISTGSNYDCNSGNGGPISALCSQPVPLLAPAPASLLLSTVDSTLALGQYNDAPDFYDAARWQSGRRLYRKLKADSSLAAPGTVFRTFRDTTAAAVIGQLHEVDMLCEQLTHADSFTMAQWVQERRQMIALQDSILSLDSLLSLNPSAQGIWAQRALLLAQFDILAQQCHGRQANIAALQNNAAQATLLQNQSIVTQQSIADYEKVLNEIYLSTIAKGIYDFNIGQTQQLLQIAAACPLEGGQAVYKARALLGAELWADYSDISACFPTAKMLASDETIVVESQNLNIFPNPGNTQISLSWIGLEEDKNYELSVYNALGQEIWKSRISTSGGQTDLDVSTWTNGLYFLSLQREGTSIERKTFSVIH